MTTKRAMGEPFFGTGKPPEGYKPGDYVEYLSQADGHWHQIYDPNWETDYSYRRRADLVSGTGERKFIIAHARTLRDGCEPMQEPVDPLVEALCELTMKEVGTWKDLATKLRARFDITIKGDAK